MVKGDRGMGEITDKRWEKLMELLADIITTSGIYCERSAKLYTQLLKEVQKVKGEK